MDGLNMFIATERRRCALSLGFRNVMWITTASVPILVGDTPIETPRFASDVSMGIKEDL
jgi:hypothetical protein